MFAYGEDGMELERMPLERLEHEIAELAAHINAATCRWLLLVAEFDRRDGWEQWGLRSCAQWLSLRCGIGSGAARDHVRVARRLEELPRIRHRFARGELSYTQVRALVRVATPEMEAELLAVAEHATGAQLETLMRAYRGVLARELEAARSQDEQRYLAHSYAPDGSIVIHARLPAEEGAKVLAALDAGRDALRAEAVSAETTQSGDTAAEPEPQPASATNADALVLMADTLLESGPAAADTAERYQVVVHVDAAALTADEDGACHVEDGAALHPETARRLACDGSLVRVLERDGRPLSVGRRTRSIPPAMKRALRARDATCRFPGCTERRFVDAHHIEHWAHGGRTELGNLVNLCRRHHRLVHEGGYAIERGGGGALAFRRPDGRVIGSAPRLRGGDCGELRGRNGGLEIGPGTCVPLGGGERLQLGYAVGCLVDLDPRLREPRPLPATAGDGG